MPIYEYQCDKCEKTFSKLLLKRDDPVECPFCASKKLTKLISSFITHRTESSRLEEFNPGAKQPENFYSDSRNIGLWAEKRAKELGLELPSQAYDAMDKARSGKLDDLTSSDKLF